jgi:hypothetical protein
MTSLFGYQCLRDQERRRWKRRPPAATLPSLKDRDRLAAQVVDLVPYSDEQMGQFVHVSPTRADRAVARLCTAYRRGFDSERVFIRSLIRQKNAEILLTFSQRAATRGFQSKKAGPIRQALVALTVEDLSAGDVRDDLVVLGLIYHCASRARADIPRLFEEVAKMAGPAMAAVLREFIDDEMDDILDAMGLEQVRSRGKTGFRWADV